jgi:hypothetical protein
MIDANLKLLEIEILELFGPGARNNGATISENATIREE